MKTRDIQTSDEPVVCDVCGRTLLRGERAEVYLSGGAARWSVCDLCTARALQEGWVREGTVPVYEDSPAGEGRRRSLRGLFRAWRELAAGAGARATREDELDRASAPVLPPVGGGGSGRREPPPAPVAAAPPAHVPEPRRVRGVPTSPEHKQASAVALFNASEHPRTVAGVARSLGLPNVSVRPSTARPRVVNVAVAWELCWYRYEVDLSNEAPDIRVADQGSELHELAPEELEPNACCDERGSVSLIG